MIILIIPIGAPGSGKTTLKNHLKKTLPNFYTTERDYEFSKLRKTNSLKKPAKFYLISWKNFSMKSNPQTKRIPQPNIMYI